MNFQTRIQTLMVIVSSLFVIIFSLELLGYPVGIDCSIINTRQEGLFCSAKETFETIFGVYGENVFNFTLVAISIYLVWYFYKNKSVIKQNYGSKLSNTTAKILAILLVSTILIFLVVKFI